MTRHEAHSHERDTPRQSNGRIVADPEEISRALRRLAHQVVENVKDVSNLVIMGIPTRGVPLAQRLAKNVGEIENIVIPVGSLDVTLSATISDCGHRKHLNQQLFLDTALTARP